MGRSRRSILIAVTQRPNVIHNSIISESYTRIIFIQELQSDRDKLAGIMGKEVAESTRTLGEYVFMVHTAKNLEYGKLKL